MKNVTKIVLLKYGIPVFAIIIVAVQLFLVKTKDLSRWKGGGYGMYTEIHYAYNQIYIPGFSVDSLVKDNEQIQSTFGRLLVMPNSDNLEKVAKLVLETTHVDSINVQIWKPIVNSKEGTYTRVLSHEIQVKKSSL